MQIAKNRVVAIDYTLKDIDGQIIDTSEGTSPLCYLHGASNIIPGLERALDGKVVGDELQVTIQPKDGYGERIEELEHVVPRKHFGDIDDLQVGTQFYLPADEDDNDEIVFVVVDVDEDHVTVDGNHELAGVVLNFDIAIRDIRDATPEEVEHGHVHEHGEHDH